MADKDPILSLVERYRPSLKSGGYSIRTSQRLDIEDHSPHHFGKFRRFEVSGPQFVLETEEIASHFPTTDAVGNYTLTLPHVVLKQPSLPWSRQLDDNSPDASWLALVLLDSSRPESPQNGTLADLLPRALFAGGKLPDDCYSFASPPTGASFQGLSRKDKPSDPLRYLELSVSTLAHFLPCRRSLDLTAHVRTLTAEALKHSLADTPEQVERAVVVSHQLPQPATQYTGLLVSLENIGGLLDFGQAGHRVNDASNRRVRLPILYSWTFATAPAGASFANLLANLNTGQDPDQPVVQDSLVRLPKNVPLEPAWGPIAPQAIGSGFTPLVRYSHGLTPMPPVTAQGNTTPGTSSGTNQATDSDVEDKDDDATSRGLWGWFRGPLGPCGVEIPNPLTSMAHRLPALSAATLRRAIADSPHTPYDQSLAAAWELGRLMALNNGNFAEMQVRFKRLVRAKIKAQVLAQSDLGERTRTSITQALNAILASPKAIAERLATLWSDPDIVDGNYRAQIMDGLAGLATLRGIPTDNLVPDARMLNFESLKFFSVDPEWIAALLDGAWSLGRQNQAQYALDTAFQPWRALFAGDSGAKVGDSKFVWPATGIVLRSALVDQFWPRITIIGHDGNGGQHPPISLVKQEDGVLRALFDVALAKLEICQPSESVHFGVRIHPQPTIPDDQPSSDTDHAPDTDTEPFWFQRLYKMLKVTRIDGRLYPPGSDERQPGDQTNVEVSLGDGPCDLSGQLDFVVLRQALAEGLGVQAPQLSAAHLALQMIETTAGQTFVLPKGDFT